MVAVLQYKSNGIGWFLEKYHESERISRGKKGIRQGKKFPKISIRFAMIFTSTLYRSYFSNPK